MKRDEYLEAVAAAAVRNLRVKGELRQRPAPPPRSPCADSHLVETIERLEELVADRERQVAALQEQRAARAAAGHEAIVAAEQARDAVQAEIDGLQHLVSDLRAASGAELAQAEEDARARRAHLERELAELLAAAKERAEQLHQKAHERQVELELAQLTRAQHVAAISAAERATLADLQALDDQIHRTRLGAYADAQRKLPELRARLAKRQAAPGPAAAAVEPVPLEKVAAALVAAGHEVIASGDVDGMGEVRVVAPQVVHPAATSPATGAEGQVDEAGEITAEVVQANEGGAA